VLQRVIEWGNGWLPNRITPEKLAESRATLDRMAKDAGRDPSSITISVYGSRPTAIDPPLPRRRATRVVVRLDAVATEPEMAAQLSRIAAPS